MKQHHYGAVTPLKKDPSAIRLSCTPDLDDSPVTLENLRVSHIKQRQRSSSIGSYDSTGSFEHINYRRRDSVDIANFKDIELDSTSNAFFSFKLFCAFSGPGWLMSIAYLDPGNLESDLQAGAYTGYQLLSVLLYSTFLGLLLQILAARVGVVTGKHLAELCREQYPASIYIPLWFMVEIAIVGSDIQEVVGSAIALEILFNIPLWIGCIITGIDTFTFLGLHYFGFRKLEAFFGALIAIMVVCFFTEFLLADPQFKDIASSTIYPKLESYSLLPAMGLLGAIIMPHNIYLHSALVQTRQVNRRNSSQVSLANKYFSIEATVALGTSFLVNLAVIAVFAKGFYSPICAKSGEACVFISEKHKDHVESVAKKSIQCTSDMGFNGVCGPIGLTIAGDSLMELLGSGAKTVWAIGLLAAGQSSTMTGTYAGQFVMQGFLGLDMAPWARVALTRMVALGPAIFIVTLGSSTRHSQEETIEEAQLEKQLNWLNVLQSVQLPFALLPLLQFSSNREIMGPFKNSALVSKLGWCLTLFIMFLNFYLVCIQLRSFGVYDLTFWQIFFLLLMTIAYFFLIVRISSYSWNSNEYMSRIKDYISQYSQKYSVYTKVDS